METVGVLVVSYGAREAAMIDAFARSLEYKPEIFVTDKQANPFNMRNAAKHVVIPDLSSERICHFAQANKDRIDFVIVGPEKPIIEGARDLIEEETGIPVICPKKQFAIEESKVKQRLLFGSVVPQANPRFKIYDPKDYSGTMEVRRQVFAWLDELEDQAVIKPDKPTAGKGVGVWGDHFKTRNELFDHFLSNFQYGKVIIEEKIDGEESSFQAFCDGKHLAPLPDTRDYKRAFDDDKGPNTGGMGSYRAEEDTLPFLTKKDRQTEIDIVHRIFNKWQKQDSEGLRGVPLYVAFMHTANEPKILENNSRPGDPEIINILPTLEDDFFDVCFRILEGNLNRVETRPEASVVTYKVPPNYGGFIDSFPDLVQKDDIGTPVILADSYALTKKYRDKLRIYPAAIEQRGKEAYALKSRAVCAVGIATDIEDARQISLKGVEAITGGALWNRSDIASTEHIRKSTQHLCDLRSWL